VIIKANDRGRPLLAIETERLTKRFGGRPVVDAVTLKVPMGCVYGFLGPNGAGKTTTMRLLLSLMHPDAGSIRLLGHDLATARRVALGQVGAFVESPSLYDHLTGRANLGLTRRMLRLPDRDVDRVLELVDLRHAAGRRVRDYSLGMKQRLALARAMLGSPKLLLLDEPTNGLDPDGIAAMRTLIRSLPERIGGTVFVSSHLLSEVEHVADHIGVMRDGRLLVQDRIGTLLGPAAGVAFTVAGEAEAGSVLLRTRGIDASAVDDRSIIVRCGTDVRSDLAAVTNQLLVEADFAVSSIRPQVRTLEDVYRNAVDRAEPGERKAA
jgi:ABC-type multidrug transport system ATPase subunit